VVREQEIEEEGAGPGEDGRGLRQGIPLLGIGSSTRACGEIQLEDGTACRFAHRFPAFSSWLKHADDDPQTRSRFRWLRPSWAFHRSSLPDLERFI
jgi:hypothetical protein